MAKLLKSPGAYWFFRTNVDKTLVANIELLKKCGVSMDQIVLTLRYRNGFMFRNPEHMKKSVNKADQLRVSRSSKVFIGAVKMIGQLSDETLEFKLRTLREVGFLEDHIAEIFRRSPTVLHLSAESLKDKVEVILSNGKYDLPCIISCPESLTYSITKRYKPRIQVLDLLEGKNLIRRWPALRVLCSMTDKMFYEKYVAPFVDEIGDDVYTVVKAASV